MNGKERFNSIIDHKRPDKLPLFIPTISCSVASEILGRPAFTGADSLHFREELSLFYGESAHREFEEKYYEDVVELHRILRVDIVRDTWRSREKPTKKLDEDTLFFGDENGDFYIKRFFPKTQTYGIIKDNRRADDPESLYEQLKNELKNPLVLPDMKQSLSGISGACRIFDMHKEKGDSLGEIIHGGGSLGIPMTSIAFLELSAMEPEFLHEYFMHIVPSEVARMKQLAGCGYRWFGGGIDMATMQSTVVSPVAFKNILAKPLQIFANNCRDENVVFCFKSDGNMWGVFDIMFNECGIQAYGEVDRDASMTVAAIRKRNENLLILGNISSALLHLGSENQVREETKIILEESEGLNFIPGPSNAIMPGTPVRNVFAMIEEIENFVP